MWKHCPPGYVDALLPLLEGKYEITQKLAFNLRMNGSFLVGRYSPQELILLDDDSLAEGSEAEKQKIEMDKQHENYQGLLQKDFLAELGVQTDCLRCRYCGAGNVEYTTKQTKGADEGSTVFLMCSNPKCKKRWKM